MRNRSTSLLYLSSLVIGAVTLASVALLLIWDAAPDKFPLHAHDALGALPLALIALACVVHRASLRPTPADIVKTLILAAAFLAWSANQLWPESSRATLLNDVAVALFVLDVYLAIRDRRPDARDL
jgi:hypothetical protein